MSKARSKYRVSLVNNWSPRIKMRYHTVDQGITLWEAQPLNNIPTIKGASDMYNTRLFSEMSHQKKVQESCLLLRWPGKAEMPVLVPPWLTSGTLYTGLGRLPTLEYTRVVEPGSRDLVQAYPKIQHLICDSTSQYTQLHLRHIQLLAGNERQIKRGLHPLAYLLTSLLWHSYNLAILVHHFNSILKFWASHHRRSKCTHQACRVRGFCFEKSKRTISILTFITICILHFQFNSSQLNKLAA